MVWARRNAIFLIFVAAVVISFVVNNGDSKARDRAQHQQIVAICRTGAERTARTAAYQFRTASARRATGDPASLRAAADYDAFAEGNLNSIPVPAGVRQGSPVMIEVVKERMPNGKHGYVVTPRAKALQAAGCERINS